MGKRSGSGDHVAGVAVLHGLCHCSAAGDAQAGRAGGRFVGGDGARGPNAPVPPKFLPMVHCVDLRW